MSAQVVQGDEQVQWIGLNHTMQDCKFFH
jgi:hypothetical protein